MEVMSQNLKKRAAGFWQNYARPFLFVAMVLLAFRSSIADWNDVPTGSMKPSILEGDRIFVNKLAYDLKVPFTTWHVAEWSSPRRGDIVVFFSPTDGRRLVKRVVALPGDTVTMADDGISINGQPAKYGALREDLLKHIPEELREQHRFALEATESGGHPVMITPGVAALRNFGPYKVPDDHYFMLGDNRDNSADSRFIGAIHRDRIVGRASTVVLSLDTSDYYLPRWGRFFTTLP